MSSSDGIPFEGDFVRYRSTCRCRWSFAFSQPYTTTQGGCLETFVIRSFLGSGSRLIFTPVGACKRKALNAGAAASQITSLANGSKFEESYSFIN